MKLFRLHYSNNTISFILLVLIIFGIYSNIFNNSFVWDDRLLITDNIFIKNPRYIKNIFASPIIFFRPFRQSNYYRPLQMLSYLFDYHIWKLNPFGYHLTNILIHILNTILVYLLIDAVFKDKKLPLLTSLFFATCPLFVSAVTYISARADLMVTFFMLYALLLFIKSIQKKNDLYYLGSLIFFLLALLSKELALEFPFILLLTCKVYEKYHSDVSIPKDIKLRYITFFSLTLTYIILRATILNFDKTLSIKHQGDSFLRFITFCQIVLSYIKLIFLPTNLHMQHSISMAKTIFTPFAFLSFVSVVLILIVIIRSSKRSNIIFWSLSWFLITIIPVYFITLSFRNSDLAMMAEHWLYIPLIGFFTLIAFITLALGRLRPTDLKIEFLKNSLLLVVCIIIFFYIAQTIKTNLDWKDEETLFTKIIKYNPDDINIRIAIASLNFKKGYFQKAISEYKNALKQLEDKKMCDLKKSDSLQAEILRNIGIIYFYKGLYLEAENELIKAIQINPLDAPAYCALGVVFAKQGYYAEAVKNINRSLDIDPYNAETYNNLGLVYVNMGDMDKAIVMWQGAIGIDPNFIESRENLQKAKDWTLTQKPSS